MKQVTIATGKATIVVVENAETMFKGISIVDHITFNKNVFPLLPDELHNEDDIYELIGIPNDLYEEDWKGIVDEEEESDIEDHRFAISYPDYCDLQRAFATATESGLSLLKANGVVMENPRGEMPEKCSCRTGQSMCFVECGLSLQYAKWLEAQEQVWLNPQIFVKV